MLRTVNNRAQDFFRDNKFEYGKDLLPYSHDILVDCLDLHVKTRSNPTGGKETILEILSDLFMNVLCLAHGFEVELTQIDFDLPTEKEASKINLSEETVKAFEIGEYLGRFERNGEMFAGGLAPAEKKIFLEKIKNVLRYATIIAYRNSVSPDELADSVIDWLT